MDYINYIKRFEANKLKTIPVKIYGAHDKTYITRHII